jgi:anti-sigma factor RsiW
MSCEETRQLVAELALGIADGADRARALRHLAECADCRRELGELSELADELLMLAPEVEPPVGFESRVLALVQPPRRPRRWRRGLAMLAPAAVAAALATTIVLGATGDDRRLADHYRDTLATANGSYFEAARLQAPANVPAGVVYGYRGTPSWIFVAVDRPYRAAGYTVELALTSGRRVPLPSFLIDPKTGSAGQAIPVDMYDVSAVLLIGGTRGEVLQAELPHAAQK